MWNYFRIFFPVFIILSVVALFQGVIPNLSKGSPLDWERIIMSLAIAGGAFLITWLTRHWLNFLAGEEICQWRFWK
ncbi:MAG: hypothetical protein H6920_08980 [Sphingomonadaceae bacterium]|nr:hypothetical protein [Sphingomonadaceae bacterium]MCP5384660.1 hypothetical protein [Altererythrobacter sp.]MCP5391739.1 hypothetical protein [Sphingomonadaceae bacterium]MCP5393853.1 hypothetical protein [Sphingomonadaceae bacterium]